MEHRSPPLQDLPPTHGFGFIDAWRRKFRAQMGEPREKVGFWFGLLLLFVPVFYFLLYFKHYSAFARLGWGLWLGLVVFVKVMGLSDAVVHIETPSEGQALPAQDATEVPLKAYLGKLLGSQYMDYYRVDGANLVITYEARDGYFGNPEVLADLAVSNGFSLLYRRDIEDLRLRFPLGSGWREVHMTRQSYREFFGLSEPIILALASTGKVESSPIYNISKEDKARFLSVFQREIPPPTETRPAPAAPAGFAPPPTGLAPQPGAAR